AHDDLIKLLEATGQKQRIERVSAPAPEGSGHDCTRSRDDHLIRSGTRLPARARANRRGKMLQNGGGLTATADDVVIDTTTQSFMKDVIEESRRQPVLVDFWAPWCGPCKQLTPVLEKAVRAANGAVKLVKMNIDEHPSIAGQLGIQSIPAVIAFRDGQPVDGFMGAVPESQVQDFIRKLGGARNGAARAAGALAAAAGARPAGDAQPAAAIYDAVLEQAPETVEAIAGLAALLREAGDTDGAKAALAAAQEA